MPTPDPSLELDTTEPTLEPDTETPWGRGLLGSLPRFGQSPRPSRSLPEPEAKTDESPIDPPAFSGPPLSETSSPASTEPAPARARMAAPEEVLDPKDLQSAVTQVADMAFVLLGQGLGRADQKARQLPAVDEKWVPTEEERKFVSEPAARIAKRHLNAPKEAMDVIDGCLIAVGVGAFAMRGVTGAEPLAKKES